ncbi:MAG: hypothetical protein RSG07_00530 [Erysipelotrichaceae bacterium]
MKVNNRERTMVIALIIFATVAIGYVLIFTPMLGMVKAAKTEADAQGKIKSDMKDTIEIAPSVEAGIPAKVKTTKAKTKFMYALVNNMNTDLYTQGNFNELKITSVQITGDPENMTTSNVAVSVEGKIGNIVDAITAINKGNNSLQISNVTISDNADDKATATFNLQVFLMDKKALTNE